MSAPTPQPRWSTYGIGLAALGGLVIRLCYVLLVRRDIGVGLGLNDAAYYHQAANLLADGRGFIEPFLDRRGVSSPAADHPPLYIVYLALFSFVGLDTPLDHQLASCLLGTATVVLLGLAGRRAAGPAAGVIVAVAAAGYPNLWAYDGFLVSESMAQLWVAVCLLLAYRLHDAPSTRAVVLLGAAIGASTLSRAELCLLVPLLLWPLVARAQEPSLDRRQRWRLAGAGTAAAVLVVVPWVGYNLARFEEPVLLSNGFEVTLLTSSCDLTYYGDFIGYWSKTCVDDSLVGSGLTDSSDRSELAAHYRSTAFEYIGDNLHQLPKVVAARIGRVTGLYAPRQQIALDVFPEGRELTTARLAAIGYYGCAIFAVVGGLALRRQRRPVLPVVVPPVIVLITVTVTFATTRYRATAEPALVLAAGVGFHATVMRIVAARRSREATDAGT